MHDFKIHNIVWDDNKIARLWDYYYTSKSLSDLYFSKMAGGYLIEFLIKSHVKLKNTKILDYGCGSGHLFIHLQEKKIYSKYYGLDFSENSVDTCNKKFSLAQNYHGTLLVRELPCQYDNESFDIIIVCEVLEHLNDEHLNTTMQEIYRLLKPNGRLVITVPNDENLEKTNKMCPDCGCIFHPIQHVRNFNTVSLSKLCEKHGFSTQTCTGTVLSSFLSNMKYTLRNYLFTPLKKPNLVYIGYKS